MKLTSNMVGWFEIPVLDLERAKAFYEKVFGINLQEEEVGPAKMVFFPWGETLPGAPGALIFYPDEFQPAQGGVMIYFSSLKNDLNDELGRVEEAGGKVVLPKILITKEIGYYGQFIDTEGNKIALHSRS